MRFFCFCLLIALCVPFARAQQSAGAQIDSILHAKKYGVDSLNYWRIGVTLPFAPIARIVSCQTSWQIRKFKAEIRAGYNIPLNGFLSSSAEPSDLFTFQGVNAQVLIGIKAAPRFILSAVGGFSYWWYHNKEISYGASYPVSYYGYTNMSSSEVYGPTFGLEFEHQYEWKKLDMAICAGLTLGIMNGTLTAMERSGWGAQQQSYPVTIQRQFNVVNVMFGCKLGYKKRIGKK